jgi:hypothetical protein
MSKSPVNFGGAIAGAAGLAGSRISRGDKIRNSVMQNMMGSGGIGSLFGGGALSKIASLLGRKATYNKAEVQAMKAQMQQGASESMGKPVIEQGAVESKLDTSTLSKNFSLPSIDPSSMDPRIASRAPKPVEARRASATLDYATGGRGTFIGNAPDPYRIGSTGVGTFMDGRGSLSTRGRGMLVGGVDARHAGLTEEQVNSNRNFTNLFSTIGQY